MKTYQVTSNHKLLANKKLLAIQYERQASFKINKLLQKHGLFLGSRFDKIFIDCLKSIMNKQDTQDIGENDYIIIKEKGIADVVSEKDFSNNYTIK